MIRRTHEGILVSVAELEVERMLYLHVGGDVEGGQVQSMVPGLLDNDLACYCLQRIRGTVQGMPGDSWTYQFLIASRGSSIVFPLVSRLDLWLVKQRDY